MKNTDNLVVNSPELRNYLITNRDLSKKNISKFSNLILQNEIEKIERDFKDYTFN